MNGLKKVAALGTIVLSMLGAQAQTAVTGAKDELHPVLTADQSGDSLGTIDSAATSLTVANESKTNQNPHNHQANDLSAALLLGGEDLHLHGGEFGYGRVVPLAKGFNTAIGSGLSLTTDAVGLKPYVGLGREVSPKVEFGIEGGPVIEREFQQDALDSPWKLGGKAGAYIRLAQTDLLNVYLNSGVEFGKDETGRFNVNGSYAGFTVSIPAGKKHEEGEGEQPIQINPLFEQSQAVPASVQQGGGGGKHHGHGGGHNHTP